MSKSDLVPVFPPIDSLAYQITPMPSAHVLPVTEPLLYTLAWFKDKNIWFTTSSVTFFGEVFLQPKDGKPTLIYPIEDNMFDPLLIEAWQKVYDWGATELEPDTFSKMVLENYRLGSNKDPIVAVITHVPSYMIAQAINGMAKGRVIKKWEHDQEKHDQMYLNHDYDMDYFDEYVIKPPYLRETFEGAFEPMEKSMIKFPESSDTNYDDSWLYLPI